MERMNDKHTALTAYGSKRTTPVPLDRRQFLRKVCASSVGTLVIPGIVPSSALGMDGFTAPSNRITLGFIGLGVMGRRSHLNSFLHRSDVQVLAVCDVDSDKRKISEEAVLKRYRQKIAGYSGCAKYEDFRDLLVRDDIDAVVIATPDHWHGLIAISAAKAGKDIYCEKPMTHTVREGRAVVEAVRRYGQVFQTGSQQRSDFGKRFQRAVELIQNGRIGKIQRIHVQVGGPAVPCDLPAQPVPERLNWDLWLGPAPYRPYHEILAPPFRTPGNPNWRDFTDYGGGGLYDFGAHHFDIAQWALGMDHSGPVEIIPPDGKEQKLLALVYSNGVPVYHGGGESSIDFIGSEGRIMVSRNSLASEPASILREDPGSDEIHLGRGLEHRQDWLQCIRTRQRPIADAEIGHRTASICSLAFIGYTLKRSLQWDAEKEFFVNDPEANRLLSYAMRSPWCI